MYLLIVDLHVRDFDLVRGALLSAGSDPLEEGVAEARDQALVVRRAHHGVRLARAGLAVGEDAGVVAREGVVEDVDPDGREDRLLRGEGAALDGQGVEAVVERERLGLLAAVLFVEGRGVLQDGLILRHGHNALGPELFLSAVEGTDPHGHAYLIHCGGLVLNTKKHNISDFSFLLHIERYYGYHTGEHTTFLLTRSSQTHTDTLTYTCSHTHTCMHTYFKERKGIFQTL